MIKLALVLLTLFPSVLIAQTKGGNLDEQKQELKKLKAEINLHEVSTKDLKTVQAICKIYHNLDLDSSLHYASIEVQLAKKMENPNVLATARLVKATLLWKLQKPELAHRLLLKNIENKGIISDTIFANTLFRIAKVEIQKQMPAESINHVVQAAEVFQGMKDSVHAAACFSHIAGIYTFVLEEPKKGIPYFDKALDYNKAKDQQNVIRININYSSAFVGIESFEKAIKKIRTAERVAKKVRPNYLPSIYVQYSYIYSHFEKHEKSLKYALLADSLIKNNLNYGRGTQEKIYWYLGLNYKVFEKYDKAIYYFEKLTDSHSLDPWEVQSHLIDIYKEVGDFERAFLLQEELIEARDSSDFLARNQQLLDVVEKYESEKNQQEIITLNAEKELQNNQIKTQRLILYGTVGFFLFLIIIGVFWFRTRSKLRETTLNLETTKLQQQFLRTQLNPHFFFHALTSIETYIYKNDKLKSAGFLRSFSVLMRNILEFSDLDFISLRQDIDFLKKYIELQQLNHEFKFNYEISVSPELNIDEIKIPPMLIQPAVENAILHGALSTENGAIFIEYSKKGDQFQVSIKDNGEARNVTQSSTNRLNRSMSLDITQTRIKNLQEVHGVTIVYHPFNSDMNDGDSSVSFSMPLEFKR
ncbi:MAG: histidine kinase [Crocinitomicaceae bacterium]|nr:histidine kinase [Flavobacteriales bacterium]NQZ38401.1 histidine kinase [Crocinitomicaceae bacterium]